MPRARGTGLTRMRSYAAGLPAALAESFERGRELSLPAESGPVDVYAAGMGGSGIAAELARGVLETETRVSITVLRGPIPPPSLSARSRVFLVSYSGGTWETLRAYEAAGRAKSYRMVLTSGGVLADAATRDRVPLLPIPSGLPPRAAVGYLLGGILGVLDPWFPESNESRIRRITERLPATIASYARLHGPADRISRQLLGKFPFIYAENSFAGLARRWKTQLEENSKQLAAFDEVPELFHNSIVAWDAVSRTAAKRYAVLLLEWSGTTPAVRQSLRYLEHLLHARGVRVVRVPLAAEDRLEALVQGLALADQVSLFLAEHRKIDPFPYDAITRFKAALEPPASRPRLRPSTNST